jgi:hypothetical protein
VTDAVEAKDIEGTWCRFQRDLQPRWQQSSILSSPCGCSNSKPRRVPQACSDPADALAASTPTQTTITPACRRRVNQDPARSSGFSPRRSSLTRTGVAFPNPRRSNCLGFALSQCGEPPVCAGRGRVPGPARWPPRSRKLIIPLQSRAHAPQARRLPQLLSSDRTSARVPTASGVEPAWPNTTHVTWAMWNAAFRMLHESAGLRCP